MLGENEDLKKLNACKIDFLFLKSLYYNLKVKYLSLGEIQGKIYFFG